MTLYLLLFTNYGHLPPVGHASTILNSIRAVTSRPRKDNAPAHHPHPPTPSKATPYPSRIPTTSRKQRRLQTAAPRSRGEQQLATSAKRKRRKRMRQNQSVRTPQVVGKDAQIDEKAMVSSRRPRFFFFFLQLPITIIRRKLTIRRLRPGDGFADEDTCQCARAFPTLPRCLRSCAGGRRPSSLNAQDRSTSCTPRGSSWAQPIHARS